MTDILTLLPLLLAAGFFAGLFGGLFGVGGGIVSVPVLYLVFQSLGVGEGASLKTAIGTSLGVIIVTSIRSLMTHHKAGHVDREILLNWAPWIALGAISGGFIARYTPVEILSLIFLAGGFYIAWRRIFGSGAPGGVAVNLMRKRLKIPIGVGTGVFSSLMGLGGGAVGVMVMTIAGRKMHQAIGTSAGFGIAVAAPGVAGFIVSGWATAGLPIGSFGYFNLPAFAAMSVMAAIAAPIGARLSHRMDGARLSKLFGVYVLIAASSIAVDVFIS